MSLEVLDSVNDPGTPGKSGDDRFGFDASAGRAWVIDGATDVTDLRPFAPAESGAAWFAEAVSRELLGAPQAGETTADYFGRVLTGVARIAAEQSRLPLDSLPGEARPVASAIWIWRTADTARFVWAGDCFALVDPGNGAVQTIGAPGKADDETAEARRLLALSPSQRLAELQAQRRASNEPRRGTLNLNPLSAAHLAHMDLPFSPGAEAILMSDGLYRLISPYALETPETLFDRVRRDGLSGALRALREHETGEASDRLKRRDDACAVWLRAKL